MTDKIIVMVTCGSRREANRLAHALVAARLAACVNVLSSMPVHSVYRWEGKIESANEILLLVKSARRKFRVLEREIRRLHSYAVPEIIAIPVSAGSKPYLHWLDESVRAPAERVKAK